MIPTRSVLDIDDLLQDPILRGLAGDAKAAMAQSGQPTGYCGQKWINTGNPAIHDIDACMGATCDCMDDQAPECDTCGGSGVIASCGRCPECQA